MTKKIHDVSGIEVHVGGACMEGREADGHVSIIRYALAGYPTVGLTFSIPEARALAEALLSVANGMEESEPLPASGPGRGDREDFHADG